jgi:DNA invertase Pin-like site-specific DNA recombinase
MNINLSENTKTVTEIPATVQHVERDVRRQQLRAAAYCRVSTDSDDQLNSYNSQIEYYTALINENPNWTMAGIFADEGLTGLSTKKRVEFNKMIRKAKAGRIDLIICKSVSRFARNALDTIAYARTLKRLGVGILFEKEGVNTFEMDDEILLTIFGSLAQAESESLSKNVSMGFRQAFKAGKVHFRYNGMLGYREGADGKPEIVPEEAAVVRRIFHRYLAGESVAQIRKDLDADGIPTATGKQEWSNAAIRHMLLNDKFVGDALLQKTFVADLLTKKNQKNNGERPQYYVTNNHPAIIERDVFNKVQEELARRAALTKTPSRIAKTEQSKYSGKFGLNGVLLCAECGAPYRRAVWTQHGTHRAVWRCISRLEHGKRLCKESPTLDEGALHAAVVSALSEAVQRELLSDALLNSIRAAQSADERTSDYLTAKRTLSELDERFDLLLSAANDGDDSDYIESKIRTVLDEREAVLAAISDYEAERGNEREPLPELPPLAVTEFDDNAVRQLIDTIRTHSGGRLEITLKGGEMIERQIPIKRTEVEKWEQKSGTLVPTM